MKKFVVATVLGTLIAAPSVSAWAQSTDSEAYWKAGSGQLRDSFGQCIRTSSWKEGTQVEGCDVIEPKPVAVVQEADSDGDGVVDSKDLCPNTPKGAKVNEQGCIPLKSVSFKLDVKFAFNSAQILEEFKSSVGDLAKLLKQDPKVDAVIHGHTDSTGPDSYNMKLSQKRAEAVVNSLVQDHGINAERLTAAGHGESSPVADNATREGRKMNRRVVVEIQAEVPQE